MKNREQKKGFCGLCGSKSSTLNSDSEDENEPKDKIFNGTVKDDHTSIQVETVLSKPEPLEEKAQNKSLESGTEVGNRDDLKSEISEIVKSEIQSEKIIEASLREYTA